jgi:RNA polymerase sigma-70 factor (ECF subfamily)
MDVIQRCQAGDERAFARLFDDYKNLVYRTAYLMLSDEQDAEDVLQEVFLAVYRSLDSYDRSKSAFTTWLHRITVNRCLNRRRKRRPLLLDVSETAGREPSPERLVEADEAVRQALSRLSDKLRVVIVLRYYWGLPYAEISQVVGAPLGTVKSRLNAALRAMRRNLDAPEDVPASGAWQQGEVPE